VSKKRGGFRCGEGIGGGGEGQNTEEESETRIVARVNERKDSARYSPEVKRKRIKSDKLGLKQIRIENKGKDSEATKRTKCGG